MKEYEIRNMYAKELKTIKEEKNTNQIEMLIDKIVEDNVMSLLRVCVPAWFDRYKAHRIEYEHLFLF